VFTDKESARTADHRPQFQKMLEYCKKNHKDIVCVVVADLSRFARNVADQGTAIATLARQNIKTVSVDEPIVDNTAAGKLAGGMIGVFNQFFSDSLSEKTKHRMSVGVKAGRWLWKAPLGYLNVNKKILIDGQRAPLVRKAFELIGNGEYATTDAVLRLLTSMGLNMREGRPVTPQTFHNMIRNPFYCGYVVSNGIKIKGSHDALVSEELFETVGERLNGKSTPHKRLNEDFPLRGFIRCAACRRPLTAGWAKGRTEVYPRYWCWTKGCRKVARSKEVLENHFFILLGMLEPTAELLAKIPELAARSWESRKSRMAADAKVLSTRLAEQNTLNQQAIVAKLKGTLEDVDFQVMKRSISEETARIENDIKALDSERSSMEDLMHQTQTQVIDFAESWRKASANGKQEIQFALYPKGLTYSHERSFFEPSNLSLLLALQEIFATLIKFGTPYLI
jgi:DNA invertase Pin-like site-specific DNA recombinase